MVIVKQEGCAYGQFKFKYIQRNIWISDKIEPFLFNNQYSISSYQYEFMFR